MECGNCLRSDCRGNDGYTDPNCPVHGSEPRICSCGPGDKRKVRTIHEYCRDVTVCTACDGKIYEQAVELDPDDFEPPDPS